MDLQINHDLKAFEVYTKEHYQDMLCTAEKEHNIAFLKKSHRDYRKPIRKKYAHLPAVASVELQDCTISPSFWINPV